MHLPSRAVAVLCEPLVVLRETLVTKAGQAKMKEVAVAGVAERFGLRENQVRQSRSI